jgi:hypothetical protein
MDKKEKNLRPNPCVLFTSMVVAFLIVVASPWPVSASSRQETWEILNARIDELYPDGSFGLKNTSAGKMLVFQRRTKGIDLAWRTPDNFSGAINFVRRSKSESAIKYGEPIAIHVYRGGYLRYRQGQYGIDLGWSRTPVYEWQFTGGRPGKPVRTWIGPRNIRQGLYNKTRKAWLVYAAHNHGVGLNWHQKANAQYGKRVPKDLQKCSIGVTITGKYRQYSESVGIFESVSGKRGKFLFKQPIMTKKVRDHRKGKKGVRITSQSQISLPAGRYFIVPSGGGRDKYGHFGSLYKPGQRQIACKPGRPLRLSFKTDSAEY